MKLLLKLTALAVGLLCTGELPAQERSDPEKEKAREVVLARVNDEIITSYDVEIWLAMRGELNRLRQQYHGEFLLKQRNKVFNKALGALIHDAAIEANAKLERVVLNQGDRKEAKGHFKLALEKNIKIYGNRANFERVLSFGGLTIADLKESILKEVLRSKYTKQKFSIDTFVAPREARSYYWKNKSEFKRPITVTFRQITVRFGKGGRKRDEAIARMAKIKVNLKGGIDFGALARQFSEDPFGKNGGLYDPCVESCLLQDARQAIAKLKQGDVSNVVERKDELILIKLEKRDDTPYEPFEKALDKIIKRLHKLKFEREESRFNKNLYSSVEVELFLEDVKLEDICPQCACARDENAQTETTGRSRPQAEQSSETQAKEK